MWSSVRQFLIHSTFVLVFVTGVLICCLCVQVIMKLMEMMDQSSDFVSMLVKKLAPPLVTLLSAEPEIQYVALRNINLVVQKRFAIYHGIITLVSSKLLDHALMIVDVVDVSFIELSQVCFTDVCYYCVK